MKKYLILFILVLNSILITAQDLTKVSKFLGNPIMVDSSSTIIIPTSYDIKVYKSSKFSWASEYYSNVIFYDFIKDSSKRLFPHDTFIKEFYDYNVSRSYYGGYSYSRMNSKKLLFYFVKSNDYDNNSKINNEDPSILYVSDKQGNNLKALTLENENAVSIDIFDKQGIAMVKMQRDSDNDRDFDKDDTDYYYIRLDLNTLTFGNKIEIK